MEKTAEEKRNYLREWRAKKKLERSAKVSGEGVSKPGDNPPGDNPVGGAGGVKPDSVSPPVSSSGKPDTPGTPQRTGRNLEKESGVGTKTIAVSFDIEKIKKAVPKFLRLFFKAFNNIFKVLNFFPRIPFEISFEDLTPEEEELFQEAAWPGVEAALPSAAKKHPIMFLFSAFFLMVLGKLGFKKKEIKKPEEQSNDQKS